MTVNDRPKDDEVPDDATSAGGSDIERNLTARSTWLRLLFMLVCIAIYAVTRVVVIAVVVLQFFWTLFTSQPNEKLTALGHSLGLYTCELIDYLTYFTEVRPFPFDKDWPSPE
jgi:hypothetical protein